MERLAVQGSRHAAEHLSVGATARFLGVSTWTVRDWTSRGLLSCERTVGGHRRYPRRQLERMRLEMSEDGRRPRARGERAAGRRGSDETASAQSRDRELDAVLWVATAATQAESLQDLLAVITEAAVDALALDHCAIYSLEPGGRQLLPEAHLTAVDLNGDGGWELAACESDAAAQAIADQAPVAAYAFHEQRGERAGPGRLPDAAQLFVPMCYERRAAGLIYMGHSHASRRFTPTDLRVAMTMAAQGAAAMETTRAQRRERAEHDEVKRLNVANLRALSSAISAKDYYTFGHAGRVAAYMAMMGTELAWPADRIAAARDVAFLHDIGKIGLSERVLQKGGPLTSEEWELVKQHPAISAEIVRPLFATDLVAGVRHHHERYDGGGYPDGLAGEEIPIIARAMCVVDSYDAMSSDRPYQRGLTYRQCLAELRRCSGSQFDPKMVEAFERVLRRLRRRLRTVTRVAHEAAGLIDTDAHALLCTVEDEQRPEYLEMTAALRAVRDRYPFVRFITSFIRAGDRCLSVLDTGETENERSHIGDPWLSGDQELSAVLDGKRLQANVISADEFGIWVTGHAPVCDRRGEVVAAVSVDVPALDWDAPACGEEGRPLDAMLQAAAIRFSRAEVEAITDGLTGLYNHRYLHERLDEELERAQRHGEQLALLFCDCDQFKAFNDMHGHKAGDAAITAVARIIESSSRRCDLPARYGGEEFVLVAVETGRAGGLTLGERIRGEVERRSAERQRPLTVSVGVAVFPDDGGTRDELLDKADLAMEAAKLSGRNRVLAYSEALVQRPAWRSYRGG